MEICSEIKRSETKELYEKYDAIIVFNMLASVERKI